MSNLSKPFYISRVELYSLKLPMIHSFTTSFGTLTDKSTVLVKAFTKEGPIGWGEGAALPFPFYKPDTTETTFISLKNYIIPQILNQPITHPKHILNLYKNVKGHNFAKAAIENATWMIYSILKKQPISKLLGGTKTKIPVGESIGIKKTISQTLEEIQLRKNQGYRRIKIKIKPGWDLKLIKAIRKKFGNLDLMVDGNSAYSLKDINVIKEMDNYKLTMIEQPLADDDIIDHATLQDQIKTPICLDESIYSAEDARKAIAIKACKIINIKPGRVGGLTETKKIHDLCKKHKIGVWCGGMLETGIGRAFNIAASSLSNFKYPNDMSPSHFYYKQDLIEPTFQINSDGYINLPNEFGLGYNIIESRIKKYTTIKTILK